jgi:hypothetical protein
VAFEAHAFVDEGYYCCLYSIFEVASPSHCDVVGHCDAKWAAGHPNTRKVLPQRVVHKENVMYTC